MDEYVCHFDASHYDKRGGLSGCAFYVTTGGTTLFKYVERIKLPSCDQAEKHALYLTLDYIGRNIPKGSSVRIYGDSESVIAPLLRNKKSREKIRLLYNETAANYHLTLTRVSRKKNKKAHKLAVIKNNAIENNSASINNNAIQIYNLVKSNTKMNFKNRIYAESKTIALDKVIIPWNIEESKPKAAKYASRLAYYQKNGSVFKDIIVDEKNRLLDGFISYLILKENNIREYNVDVYKKMI